MPIENQCRGDHNACQISGALCIWEAAVIWEKMRSLLEDPLPLTIDLSAVEECDAAGIQILCQIQRTASLLGLVTHMMGFTPAVLLALQQAGLDPTKLAALAEKK